MENTPRKRLLRLTEVYPILSTPVIAGFFVLQPVVEKEPVTVFRDYL